MRRRVQLQLETLEKRMMPSQNVWFPQRLDPIGGIDQTSHMFQLFRPSTAELKGGLGFTSGSLSFLGDVSFTNDGSYDLELQASGALDEGTFLFSEWGTVTFSLTNQGTLDGNGYSFSSLVLTQTASLNWSWTEYDSNGNPLTGQNGVNTLTVTSLGTSVVDATFWQGFNWYDLTDQLVQNNNLNLAALDIAVLTIESTGVESYAFEVTGQQTLIGVGNVTLPSLMQVTQENSTYTLATSYSYANQGTNTFSLSQIGSRTSGVYDFTNIVYAETGDGGFSFTETGSINEVGSGDQGYSQILTNGDTTQSYASARTYQFDKDLTYYYSESAGGCYSLNLDGAYNGYLGGFIAGSVTYEASGEGSYSVNLEGTENSAGTFTENYSASGYGGNLGNTSNQSSSGNFTLTALVSHSESGAGLFSISVEGDYSGAYNFNSVDIAQSAEASFTYGRFSTYTDTSAGTITRSEFNALGFNDPLNNWGGQYNDALVSLTDVYSRQSTAGTSLANSGHASYTLKQIGGVSAGAYSLSCYLLSSNQRT